MSDVPELDRLLDDHRNYQTNMRFMRQERLFMWLCRVALALVVVTAAGVIVGRYGLLTIPVVWHWASWLVPEPQWRDPFKRYRYM